MPEISELSTTKECLYSGLIMAFCAHCRGDDDELANAAVERDFEITGVFEARYSGYCAVNPKHIVRKGTRVGFVQHADNPMVPVRGVACATCTRDLPKAKR